MNEETIRATRSVADDLVELGIARSAADVQWFRSWTAGGNFTGAAHIDGRWSWCERLTEYSDGAIAAATPEISRFLGEAGARLGRHASPVRPQTATGRIQIYEDVRSPWRLVDTMIESGETTAWHHRFLDRIERYCESAALWLRDFQSLDGNSADRPATPAAIASLTACLATESVDPEDRVCAVLRQNHPSLRSALEDAVATYGSAGRESVAVHGEFTPAAIIMPPEDSAATFQIIRWNGRFAGSREYDIGSFVATFVELYYKLQTLELNPDALRRFRRLTTEFVERATTNLDAEKLRAMIALHLYWHFHYFATRLGCSDESIAQYVDSIDRFHRHDSGVDWHV
jgi:hypothetical protein